LQNLVIIFVKATSKTVDLPMKDSRLQQRVPPNLQAIILNACREKQVVPQSPRSSSKLKRRNSLHRMSLLLPQQQPDSPTVASSNSDDFNEQTFLQLSKASSFRIKVSSSSRDRDSSNHNKSSLNQSSVPLTPKSPKATSTPTPTRRSFKLSAKLSSLFPPVAAPDHMSPQDFLMELVQSRGYSTQTYSTLDTAYTHNGTATPLQLASCNAHVLSVIRQGDAARLDALLECGLSPDACNCFGESLVHLACRRNDTSILSVLLHHNANVQVADDYGRTPLHEVCYAGGNHLNTQLVTELLDRDVRMLFFKDARGCTPLMHVPNELWDDWIDFLQLKANVYWRQRYPEIDGVQEDPPLTKMKPGKRLLLDPVDALSTDIVRLVCDGKLSPMEGKRLHLLRMQGIACDPADIDSSRTVTVSSGQLLDKETIAMDELADMKDLIHNRSVPWSRCSM
jgi:hypothetical protein